MPLMVFRGCGFLFRIKLSEFPTKNLFWANLGQKSQRFLICQKIDTHGITRMLILLSIFIFWISNSKFLLGQIWAKKVKVVRFAWKLAHIVSRGCWCSYATYLEGANLFHLKSVTGEDSKWELWVLMKFK